MRDFVLPFKPEELLAQPSDDRLWAADLPPVDDWESQRIGKELDALVGRLLQSSGRDLCKDKTFSFMFALLQSWPRIEDDIRSRVVDLLLDAARRVISAVEKQKNSASKKDQDEARKNRIAAKVATFLLRWATEQTMKQSMEAEKAAGGRGRGGKGRGRGGQRQEEQAAAQEEVKEAQRALERSRGAVLTELTNLIGTGSMAWLWLGDPAGWQQVAQAVSDAGFLLLDWEVGLKNRETRQASLRCVAEPLLQEGHQHSNLLVATVSKLMYGLRSGEGGAPFAADVLLLAHTTPLPRLFLVELPQHCNGAELTSQPAFQRSLANFLVAVTERLPHVILANISILLPLLDIDCYPLRSAIVESIGHLVSAEGRKLPSGAHCESAPKEANENGEEELPAVEEEADAATAQEAGRNADAPVAYFSLNPATKKDLLETLMTRTIDKSVWVRYRALQTLTGLANKPRAAALPRDQWARVLEIATRRMQDSASTSRKASMQLVRALIEFHPYGPSLQGSGDEKTKAKHLLQEISTRYDKLNEEEAKEAEAVLAKAEGKDEEEAEEDAKMEEKASDGKECEDPAPTQDVLTGDGESQAKRRRIKAKTVTERTIAQDIDKGLADDGALDGDRQESRDKQREALKRMHQCYTQRLQFVELLDAAETRLRALLASRTTSDVTEAIGVVVELRLKGVPAAARAFDQVLGLVWSRQAPIKDAAVDAFYRMHLEGRDASSAVDSLLHMYAKGYAGSDWSYTHLASVQELIQQAAEKQCLDAKASIAALVQRLDGPHCALALRALTALGAAAAPQLAAQLPRIAELMGAGGSARGMNSVEQLDRSRLVTQLLIRLYSCLGEKLVDDQVWAHMWSLCQHAVVVVVDCFTRKDIPPHWFGAMQAVMDLTFELAFSPKATTAVQQCPDKVWEQVLSRMLCTVLQQQQKSATLCDEEQAADEDAAEKPAPTEQAFDGCVGAQALGCAVFVAGHLSLRMLVYLETLQSALKKKRLAEEDKRIEDQREGKKKQKKGKKEEDAEKENQEASMGMAGQEEREADAFQEMSESGILYGSRCLLDQIKPMLFACLLGPAMRKDATLRRLGAITLCKYMTVSKKFCQENLQLLFSILFPKGKAIAPLLDEESAAADPSGMGVVLEDTSLRQSLFVAVGDLLFRHPNLVEPWTNRLYAALGSITDRSDEAAELRLTALLVLTHLVLNDMMKPRASLLARVLWLTAAKHDATARTARIMFQELAKRSTNVIYNLLPQIISSLPDHADPQATGGADERVQYIMQFVDKDKQIEGLIEKFSVRLEQAANVTSGKVAPVNDEANNDDVDKDEVSSPDKSREAVTCLSNALGSMNYTDRCLLRLHDVVVVRKSLQTAISYHPVTQNCLLSVVEKARRPKAGRSAAEGAPEGDAPAPAEGGDGKAKNAAAVAAIDAIEQTVQALARGKAADADHPMDAAEDAPPLPAKASRRVKRTATGATDPDAEDEAAPKAKAKARGRGRGAQAEKKEGGAGRGRGGRGGRKRKAEEDDDNSD